MKKLLSILLIMTLVISMAACNITGTQNSNVSQQEEINNSQQPDAHVQSDNLNTNNQQENNSDKQQPDTYVQSDNLNTNNQQEGDSDKQQKDTYIPSVTKESMSTAENITVPFTWEFSHVDSKAEYYFVKVDDKYNENPEDDYQVWYCHGTGGINMTGILSLAKLKQGVIASISLQGVKESIAANMAGVFRVDNMTHPIPINNTYNPTQQTEESSSLAVPIYNNERNFNDVCKAFGLTGLTWHENPKKEQDYIDNFLYSYICGDWEFDEVNRGNWTQIKLGKWQEHLGSNWFTQAYGILGEYMNCFECCAYFGFDNKYYIYTSGDASPFTAEEMTQHLYETYDAIVAVYNDFHSKNANKIFNSDLKLAQEYYDYCISNIKKGDYVVFAENVDKRYYQYSENIRSMICDGAYNCLSQHRGACGPTQNTLTALLSYEGISAFGVHGKDLGGGHTITMARLDGKWYLIDWGNDRGIFEYNTAYGFLPFIPYKKDMNTSLKHLYGSSKVVRLYSCITDKYFTLKEADKSNGKASYSYIAKYNYPDRFNEYVPWMGDYSQQIQGNTVVFNDLIENGKKVIFNETDMASLNSQKIYLLSKDLSDMVLNGEISFEEAVKPFEECQNNKENQRFFFSPGM